MIFSDKYISTIRFFLNFNKYLDISVCFIGFIGNCLILTIYSQTSLKKLPIVIYLRALTFTNLLVNLNLIRKFIEAQTNFNLTTKSDFSCKFLNYLDRLIYSMSSWFQLAASFHLLISVLSPNHFKFIQKICFIIVTVSLIAIFNMAYYAYSLFAFKLNTCGTNQTYHCCEIDRIDQYYINLMELFNTVMVPFLLMVISTIVIIMGVIRVKQHLKIAHRRLEPSVILNAIRNVKFGFTIILLNFSFMFLIAPKCLFYLPSINVIITTDPLEMVLLTSVVITLRDFFYSWSFLAQILVNNFVRKELVDFFIKLKSKLINS